MDNLLTEDPGFGPDDPRWIGAWWLGFTVQGILLIIFTIPIALFPKRLPSQKNTENVAHTAEKVKFKDMFAGIVDAIKRLGKNPIFIFLTFYMVMKIFGHFGHAIMLPKYMENQFRLSASDASLFSGASSVFCIILSTVFGGFLIWKYRPRAKILLAGMITSETFLCLGYLILMIPRCQPAQMMHYGESNDGLILNNTCNQECECSVTAFTPFCAQDENTVYFSPCFAGCTLQLIDNQISHKEFGNCSCAVDEEGDMGGKITEGFCADESCWPQTLAYICILLILVTITNTFTVAFTMLVLRSVHPSDKSIALGTFETFICMLGFIPFPVMYGALVDSACLIWEKSCGQTGNCWFYNMEKYNYLLHGVSSFFCCIGVFSLTTLYFLSPRLRDLYKDDEEVEIQTMDINLDTVSSKL